jgi:GTP-binding protein HflX
VIVNKADAADPQVLDRLRRHEPHSIVVSARTGRGLAALRDLIADELPRPDIDVKAVIPYDRGDLVSRLHQQSEVLSTEHREDGTFLHAKVHPPLLRELNAYLV